MMKSTKKKEKKLIADEIEIVADESEEEEEEDFFEEDKMIMDKVVEQIDNKLKLEEYIVEGKQEKWTNLKQSSKNGEAGQGSDFEVIENGESYEELVDISQYLRNGYTYITATVKLKNNEEFSFDDQIAALVSNEKSNVVKIDVNRFSVDVGRMLYSESTTEACLFVFIQNMEDGNLSYLITSTIPCRPSFNSSKVWSEKLSGLRTILETIEYIAAGFSKNVGILESIKKVSTLFKNQKKNHKAFGYAEKIKFEMEWEYPLYLELPTDNDHKQWAYGSIMTKLGKKESWKTVCDQVEKAINDSGDQKAKELVNLENDGEKQVVCNCCSCSDKLKLFKMKNGTFNCDECIRTQLYSRLRLKKFPEWFQFELQSGVTSLDILTVIVPLPILNIYIRMVYEKTYKEDRIVENCPSCKSTLTFDKEPENEHRANACSCPCGYSWCSKCQEVPHWPMTCKEFDEWNDDWQWRYSATRAIGDPNIIISRFICFCERSLVEAMMRVKSVECPICGSVVPFELYKPWRDNHYSRERNYHTIGKKRQNKLKHLFGENWIEKRYSEPVLIDFKLMAELPIMKKDIIQICSSSRRKRFDIRRNMKIRAKNGSSHRLKTISQTILYLAENVTGYMFIRKDHDQNVAKKIEKLLENRKLMIDDEDKREPIFYQKLEADIDALINSVEKKKQQKYSDRV